MKNYELIAQLVKFPAGYEITFVRILTAEEHEEHTDIDISCTIGEIDFSDSNEEIILLAE